MPKSDPFTMQTTPPPPAKRRRHEDPNVRALAESLLARSRYVFAMPDAVLNDPAARKAYLAAGPSAVPAALPPAAQPVPLPAPSGLKNLQQALEVPPALTAIAKRLAPAFEGPADPRIRAAMDRTAGIMDRIHALPAALLGPDFTAEREEAARSRHAAAIAGR